MQGQLARIPTEELLYDRQEAFNDIVACLAAKAGGCDNVAVENRLRGNAEQIEVIRIECQRRGFDPAVWRSQG